MEPEPPPLEEMSDKQLFKRRLEVWKEPLHREAVDAEIQRRQLARAERSALAAARASYAALATATATLLTLLGKMLGWW